MYFVYILKCKDGTFYCGSTNDFERRFHAHNNLKSGAHYTKIRRPVKVAYLETVKSFSRSRSREAEIKRMSKKEKTALIKANKIL